MDMFFSFDFCVALLQLLFSLHSARKSHPNYNPAPNPDPNPNANANANTYIYPNPLRFTLTLTLTDFPYSL